MDGNNQRFSCMLLMLIMIIMTTLSTCQELRPSDHGLEFQNDSPEQKKKSSAMRNFFHGSSSEFDAESTSAEKPKAVNSSDTTDWWSWERDPRRSEKEHVKKVVLLAVSLVCGVSGVVFLVAVAFIFVTRVQRTRLSAPSLSPSPLFGDK